ncbi:MAG TPA: transcriptional regulator [Myxococcota bacterium]|jgi:predicted Zn-ribbon and HTH transcriptional regulator|nr:transcriptional regulator [Myxococcota bacterium]
MSEETIRERLARLLREGPRTSRDLSRLAGIREHDVAEHLEHLARSLRARGERLEREPPACFECGFVFRERRRTTRPGHCPACRSVRISLPRFWIETDR